MIEQNQENNSEPQDENIEDVTNVSKLATEMQVESVDCSKAIEKYFDALCQKLKAGNVYLETLKNNIENIKLLLEEDHDNNINSEIYLKNIEMDEEEIEKEMKDIQEKLNTLQSRISKLKTPQEDHSKMFEDNVNQ